MAAADPVRDEPVGGLRHAVAVALLLSAASCSQPPTTASVTVPPIPAGEARVWFYRPLNVYDSLATPYIRMNDAVVAVSQPGGASYRDVPAGPYHITVDSYGRDFDQFRDVQLRPGEELYVKIVSLSEWATGSGGGGGGEGGSSDFARSTFYVRLIPAEVARSDIAHSAFYGG